jgi:hypothetical protein
MGTDHPQRLLGVRGAGMEVGRIHPRLDADHEVGLVPPVHRGARRAPALRVEPADHHRQLRREVRRLLVREEVAQLGQDHAQEPQRIVVGPAETPGMLGPPFARLLRGVIYDISPAHRVLP